MPFQQPWQYNRVRPGVMPGQTVWNHGGSGFNFNTGFAANTGFQNSGYWPIQRGPAAFSSGYWGQSQVTIPGAMNYHAGAQYGPGMNAFQFNI